MDVTDHLDLLDYRRRVAELYAAARRSGASPAAWQRWRSGRDALMREHPSSPYPPGRRPTGLAYFDHDPAFRVLGELVAVPARTFGIAHSSDGVTTARAFAEVRFQLAGRHHALPVFWLEQYGGGLFLPFRDLTAGTSTYGGGRYLLDTVKGADLGVDADRLVLDFNYAYHPSCFHDPRWSCPLAPPGSELDVEVTAGERVAAEVGSSGVVVGS